jgi:RHS repeat-associated protein
MFGVGLDEPLFVIAPSTGTITYLHSDDTGSIIGTSDPSGNSINQNFYSPFGESTSVNSFNFGFTGQRLDPETGLYYYKARYYSPVIGRFLQTDPIGYDGGTLNLYEYANNEGINSTDSSGLAADGGKLIFHLGAVENVYLPPSSKTPSKTFLQALGDNADAFWAPYRNPWFWFDAGISFVPSLRLGIGAIETAVAVKSARGLLTAAYRAAKIANPGASAQRIGQLAHAGLNEAIEAARPTALKAGGRIFKQGIEVRAGAAAKGGAELDARVVSKVAGNMASIEAKTGKAILRNAQRNRIMQNAPKINTWFGSFEAPVFEIKPLT